MAATRDRVRTTREVLESHLELRKAGDLERDLAENYSEDVVVLTCSGVWSGHDGIREQAAALERSADPEAYEYGELIVDGELGYMEWHAEDDGVHYGADSYLVRDGLLVAQTIHYVARGS